MPYELLEEITRADIAFKISGKDIPELFLSAAEAVISVMIENPKSISHRKKRKAEFKNAAIDMLLYDFLNELIYVKDAESLLLIPKTINLTKNTNNAFIIKCEFFGEQIDDGRHVLKTDVKAVTLHNLTAAESETGWAAVFVLDV
ncbi:MAG: archease [Spirochaetes bacterium]|nr:archease [Spirochaetota bacterium]